LGSDGKPVSGAAEKAAVTPKAAEKRKAVEVCLFVSCLYRRICILFVSCNTLVLRNALATLF
jgi:hypothetical protein